MHCWPFSIILKNELLFTTSITIICTKVISRDYFIRFMLPIVYMKNNIVGNTILFFPWTSITIVHSSFTVWCVCWQKNCYSSLFLIAIFPNRTQIIVSLSHFPEEKNTILVNVVDSVKVSGMKEDKRFYWTRHTHFRYKYVISIVIKI